MKQKKARPGLALTLSALTLTGALSLAIAAGVMGAAAEAQAQSPANPVSTPQENQEEANMKDDLKNPFPLPADSLYHQSQVMPDTWVFTDGLGRTALTNADVGDPKEDHTLAMFYWTWHTFSTASRGAVNTSELLAAYPEAKNDYNHEAWQGKGHYCFWNEPIYGYYRTDDAWVLRRQAELLANAGVDTIFTDNTNGGAELIWKPGYDALYAAWDDAQRNGAVDVPAVSFHFPFAASGSHDAQVRTVYRDVYQTGRYQNLWFYWDDKPMIMGFYNNFKDAPAELDREIYDFFTWRAGQPSYVVDKTTAGQWGWLSTFPQARYSRRGMGGVNRGVIEQMSVGVAVNHNYVTHEITAMNGENVMGRSYTSDYPNRYAVEGKEASKWGYQFAEQFEYALENDPELIFVTGWNEWHAWRQPTPWGGENSKVNNALVDQFDDEFSRDLEPTKGPLQDHYYYQFVNFARRYKGANPIPTPSAKTTIDLSAGTEQWKTVAPYYAAYIGNTDDRNAPGYGTLVYTETSGRNDIIGAQVARDDQYVYFLVECAEDITPYTDPLWMNLYIDCNQKNPGWNTFDFVVNKSAASADTLVLERFTKEGDYAATEKVADVPYTLDGRYLTVKIEKSSLGLTGDDYTINFSWTDNVHDEGNYNAFSGDIMDFYISGDVAPGGRFKYSYISTASEDPAPTESDTLPADTADTSDPTATTGDTAGETTGETTGEDEKSGCQSAVGLGALGTLAIATAGAALLKKKENE